MSHYAVLRLFRVYHDTNCICNDLQKKLHDCDGMTCSKFVLRFYSDTLLESKLTMFVARFIHRTQNVLMIIHISVKANVDVREEYFQNTSFKKKPYVKIMVPIIGHLGCHQM